MFFKKRKFFNLPRFFNKSIYLFDINVILKKKIIIFIKYGRKIFFKINTNLLIKKKDKYLYLFFINNNYNIIGTIYSLLNNIVLGLTKYFFKKLILLGVGYKFFVQKKFLYLFLGFSHPVIIIIPNNINIFFISNTNIIIFGISKQFVNMFSSFIKKYKKINVYKGKGIRYFNDNFILKNVKKNK